jgi:hypothetical protein
MSPESSTSDRSSSEVVAFNLIPMRDGISVDEFADFSSTLDRPTCLAQDVVVGFDAYRVIRDAGFTRAFDVVEVMHVRSWPEWERVRDDLAELRPVTKRFGELVDASLVRTFLATKMSGNGRS